MTKTVFCIVCQAERPAGEIGRTAPEPHFCPRPKPEPTKEEWRAEALKCRRIIKALPDCLTKNALWDVSCHLGAELQDQEALDEFWELVGGRATDDAERDV